MTPAQLIADLDAALVEVGQDVFLRKTNSSVGQLTARARVRFYKPFEVAGIIQAGDSLVVISPTGLETFGIPPANGYVVVNGVPRRIIAPNPTYVGGTLVRIDLQVRG
jgi:hypothetical protein